MGQQLILRASSPRVIVLGLASCALSFAACGGHTSSTLLRGDALGERVEAPAASAANYQTSNSEGGPVGPEVAAAGVARGVEAAAHDAHVEMSSDGRLSLLAGWTLEHLGDGATPPPQALVEFFARHLGLVEPVPHLLILGQPDPAGLEAGVHDSVARFLERQPYDHYGVGVAERGGLTLAVVTLSDRPLDFEPVPRSVEPGAELQLRGRLHAGYASPTFAITAPDGTVQRLPAGVRHQQVAHDCAVRVVRHQGAGLVRPGHPVHLKAGLLEDHPHDLHQRFLIVHDQDSPLLHCVQLYSDRHLTHTFLCAGVNRQTQYDSGSAGQAALSLDGAPQMLNGPADGGPAALPALGAAPVPAVDDG